MEFCFVVLISICHLFHLLYKIVKLLNNQMFLFLFIFSIFCNLAYLIIQTLNCYQ